MLDTKLWSNVFYDLWNLRHILFLWVVSSVTGLMFDHCPQNQFIAPINKDFHRIYVYTLALHGLSEANCQRWNWLPVSDVTSATPLCSRYTTPLKPKMFLCHVYRKPRRKTAFREIHLWFSAEDCWCLFKGVVCLMRTRALKSVLVFRLFGFLEKMNCSAINIKKK